jgi:NADPH-dependent F420 reductase
VGRLAILGGTGGQGFGLALRFAAAGEALIIGSRSPDKAAQAAAKIRERVAGATVSGTENVAALNQGERVLLAFPAAGLVPFLDAAPGALAGKLVIDVMVPLSFHRGFADVAPNPEARSMGELVQTREPRARVVSAFKNVPAELLTELDRRLEGDVLVCSDDDGARREVMDLVRRIRALRPVDAGPLAGARHLEAITALLVNLNRRHHARTSIAVVGLA